MVIALLFAGPLGAFAQTEAGVVLSGAFSTQPGSSVCPAAVLLGGCPVAPGHVNPGVSIEGILAHSVANFHVTRLSLELPVSAIPRRGTDLPGITFSTLVVTPGMRLSFVPKQPVSPFFTAGAGLAHFSGNTHSITKGAVAFSGGVDFKTPISHVAVRTEVRDLIAPWPSLITKNGLSNNVMAGAGFVFRF
jgi:hypothetical protein